MITQTGTHKVCCTLFNLSCVFCPLVPPLSLSLVSMNYLLGGVLGMATSTIGESSPPISSFKSLTCDVHRGQSTADMLKLAIFKELLNELK